MFDARDDIIDLFEKGTFPYKGKLFKKYSKNIFIFQCLLFCQKKSYKAKDYEENNELVNVIKSGIIDLKDDIKKMSKRNRK